MLESPSRFSSERSRSTAHVRSIKRHSKRGWRKLGRPFCESSDQLDHIARPYGVHIIKLLVAVVSYELSINHR